MTSKWPPLNQGEADEDTKNGKHLWQITNHQMNATKQIYSTKEMEGPLSKKHVRLL